MEANRAQIRAWIIEAAQPYEVADVILFGSRARNEAREDSDWDILVLLKEQYTPRECRDIAHTIRIKLSKNQIYADVLIKNIAEYEEEKKYKFMFSYQIAKSAISL
jgi:uncharacterized protein